MKLETATNFIKFDSKSDIYIVRLLLYSSYQHIEMSLAVKYQRSPISG